MNNELQLFKFENQKVRTLIIKNEPYFVAADVTKILGLSNTTVALNRLDSDERSKFNLGRQGMTNVVNESGLYELVLASRKPNAHRFKRWITHEVLPAIRKHGAYMTDQKAFDVVHNKDGLADLLQQAADQLKEKDIQIEQMKPKAIFADAVSVSQTAILVGELAKILKGNGINIGQNRLFKWLRDRGYLISRKGTDYNMPTQLSMNLGLFKIKETSITHSDGHVTISKTPKVTGKGQTYFVNKLLRGDQYASN